MNSTHCFYTNKYKKSLKNNSVAPYLSIVVAARNDNYGGDFYQRLQNSISWNCQLLEEYRIPSEILIVNYNPLIDAVPLTQSIHIPEGRHHVTIRVITVPTQIHEQYHDRAIRKKLPFYEFPAKNIGIRRAQGAYILSTNADILLHPALVKQISKQSLQPGNYYRANRIDYRNVNASTPTRELLKEAYKNAFLYSAKGFKYSLTKKIPLQIQLAVIERFNNPRLGWELFKIKHQTVLSRYKIYHNPHNAEYRYHVTNCGDFMLMHRQHWMDLKGNPENTYISTHTDALFVVMAAVSGLQEKVFSHPVFHQEHERRFTWNDIDNSEEFRKVYLQFQEKAQQMMASGKAIIDNPENWGAAEASLLEEVY